MNHLSGLAREQKLLLPEAVDDYFAAEAPVRFIDAFVNTLDLHKLGFDKAVAADTGRPPYHPGDLLRLYLYGYLHRIRSSRLLEKECHKNLEVIWLLRTLKPDFKTIADFRKDNKKPLQLACREFTFLCKKLNLFGNELIAIDGSKFKAVNSKDKNYNANKLRELITSIDARISKYLKDLDDTDNHEPPDSGGSSKVSRDELQKKIQSLKERKGDYEELAVQLDEDHKQLSTTDPDSRLMHTRLGADVCYNVQSAIDAKHKLIVAHDVTNDVNDLRQLSTIAKEAKAILGVAQIEAVADKGYYNNFEVQLCVENGIIPYLQKTDTSANTKLGLWGKSKFQFDPAKDIYRCPGNKELTYRFSTHEKDRELRYYRASDCKICSLRPQCTRNKENRTITREENEGLMEAMAQRLKDKRDIMKLRRTLVEHPFGTIKRWMDAGYFLCKGLAAVRAEMSLSVMAYNLKRVLNTLSFADLMKAVAKNA